MQTHMGPMVRRHPALATAALWLAVSLSSTHAAPDREAGGALRAADPAHPAAAPVVELPPSPTPPGPHPSSERRAAIELWRQANERVAEFPRGHIDILRWEAAQPAADNGPAGPVAAHVRARRQVKLQPVLLHKPRLCRGSLIAIKAQPRTVSHQDDGSGRYQHHVAPSCEPVSHARSSRTLRRIK